MAHKWSGSYRKQGDSAHNREPTVRILVVSRATRNLVQTDSDFRIADHSGMILFCEYLGVSQY